MNVSGDEMLNIVAIGTYCGAGAFRQALEPFARIVKDIKLFRLIVDGEHCVALLEIDTPFGRIVFAEHIQVVGGQIVFIRGYYDPRPILEGTAAAEN
jgi:hypothetical protein